MSGCARSGYIRIDETPVQVIHSEKAASSEHWMWVRVAGPPRQRIILFDYDRVAQARWRHGSSRVRMGWSRAMATAPTIRSRNDYGLIHCGCIAHARRKFFEAIKALPKEGAEERDRRPRGGTADR
jgi:transposase